MIKEATGFGNTIDEAKEAAVLNLGASIDDDIQFEIVTMPKKKVLGMFGGAQAEVRVFIETPDRKPPRDKKNNKNKGERSAKKAEKAPVVPKAEQPAKAPAAKKQDKKEDKKEEQYAPAVPASEIPAESPTGKAIAYLSVILEHLGCTDVAITAAVGENGALVNLEGEGLGVAIGRRGEMLDALQYLTSLSANSKNGYFRVTLNIGDYREKREQTLVALADRMAKQVLRTGRSRSLEPMNPYERRIIHTAVQAIEGVESSSFGDGSHRRVVIYPEGKEARPPRDNRYNRDGRGRGRGGRDRRPSATVASEPTREPKRDSDIPLYGKIN